MTRAEQTRASLPSFARDDEPETKVLSNPLATPLPGRPAPRLPSSCEMLAAKPVAS